MFDKNLFDRNAFDRSVSSDGITSSLLGSSRLDFKLIVKSPLPLINFSGSGKLTAGITIRQNIGTKFSGVGTVKDTAIILKRSTTLKVDGQGTLRPNVVVKTPISAKFSGRGNASVDSRVLLYQYIRPSLSGGATVVNKMVVSTKIAQINFIGSGRLAGRANLEMPLTISMNGISEFNLRRLGALNENVIELIGINIMPGESVTIDTDLLQVLLGSVEDVSSVTTDSVFFELNPGTNDILVSTDSNGPIEVTAIWQNRWL